MAKLVAHEPTSRATKQRRPEALVALLSYSTRLSLLVRGCAAIVRGALAAATLWVLVLLKRLSMLSVSRTALRRVLALLVLLGVCLVTLATLLIIRSWMLVVLGLTVSLLAL